MFTMESEENCSLGDILLHYDGTQKEPERFKDYLIHVIMENHPLGMMLEKENWTLPCLLVTKYEKYFKFNESLMPVEDETVDTMETMCESFAGSPLKLQEFYTQSFMDSSISIKSPHIVTNSLKPVTVDEARSLLSEYSLSWQSSDIINQNRDGLPPLWVLCDGKDPHHNAMLGCHVSRQDNQTQYLVTSVTVQGPVFQYSKKVHEIWEEIPPYFKSSKALSPRCYAKYSLLGKELCELHFQWSKVACLMEMPPSDAKPVMTATVMAGDPDSPVYTMYTEFSILQHLLQAVASGDMEWSGKTDGTALLAKVKALFKGNSCGSVSNKCNGPVTDCAEGDTTLGSTTVFLKESKFGVKRNGLDFTEELWCILKECHSYDDLVTCFQFIFDYLMTEDVQCVIDRDNNTTLAQLIQKSYYAELTLPALEGVFPLELLLEIGVNKLLKDYVQIFEDLDAPDILQPFLRDDNTTAKRVANLEKIHYTTELLALLESLDLPHTVLHTAARLALKHYETNAVCNGHTFMIPVHMSSVWPAIAKFKLITWQAVLPAKKCGSTIRFIYLATEKPQFEHLDETMQDVEGTDRPHYVTCVREDIIVL